MQMLVKRYNFYTRRLAKHKKTDENHDCIL